MQGTNLVGLLIACAWRPVLHKFGAMLLRPFQNQGGGTPGHLAFQEVQGPDVDQYFIFRPPYISVITAQSSG